MAKVLPDLVCRSAGAGEEGRAVPLGSVDEEGRPFPLGFADKGGRPRALLAAGCGTEAGCNFLGQPRLGGWAGSASSGGNAGFSLKTLTTSWWVPT